MAETRWWEVPAGARRAQPALFGLAALCFLLPFADVSCGAEPSAEVSLTEDFGFEHEEEKFPFKGYELVIGKDLPAAYENVFEAVGLDGAEHHVASEPFAVVAFASALAGLGMSLLLPPARRGLGGFIAGLSGIAAMALLGLSPIIRVLGLLRVTWRVGYWACLLLLVAGAAASFVMLRRGRGRPRPQAPELDRGGLGVQVRPPPE